jgi:hypothetical protein
MPSAVYLCRHVFGVFGEATGQLGSSQQRLGISVRYFSGLINSVETSSPAFEGGGVYHSTDNGDDWTLIDNG